MKYNLEKPNLNVQEGKNLKNLNAKKYGWRLPALVLTEAIVGALIVGVAIYAIRGIGAGGQAGPLPKTDRVTMVGARDVKYNYDEKAWEKERAAMSEMLKAASKKPKDDLKGQPPMQEGRQ